MTAVLNIGLHIDGKLSLLVWEVLSEVDKLSTVQRAHYWQSDTEPTVVAVIARPLTSHELFYLAEILHQGAIAQLTGKEGVLIGPSASQWGPFDATKFIMPDGRRASEHAQT